MLHTVRYIEHENKKLVVDFDSLYIDPVSTHKKALESIDDKEIKETRKAINAIIEKDGSIKEIYEASYKHKEAQKKFIQQYKKAFDENPVHFEPRQNEIILPIEEIEILRAKVEQGERVYLDD